MNTQSSSSVRKSDIAEPLDSMADIASRIHTSKRTVARAVERGELVPVKFNPRLVRFRRSEVDRWIAQAEGRSE